MRVPNDHPLARTYALLDAECAAATAESLRGTTEPAEVEALVELVLNREAGATAANAALHALVPDASPLVSDTVVRALNSPHASVRVFAVGEVARRKVFAEGKAGLTALLARDPFWQVRRAAVNALAQSPTGRDSLRRADEASPAAAWERPETLARGRWWRRRQCAPHFSRHRWAGLEAPRSASFAPTNRG